MLVRMLVGTGLLLIRNIGISGRTATCWFHEKMIILYFSFKTILWADPVKETRVKNLPEMASGQLIIPLLSQDW